MKNKKTAIVILSGGVDSTTLLYDMKKKLDKVYAITFDYRQKHRREIECAKMTCAKLGVEHLVVDVSALNILAPSALTRDNITVPLGHYTAPSMKQTVVPNRNMVMIALATSYAISKKARYVCYGAHTGDSTIYPDCRSEFVSAMGAAILEADWHQVELLAPYLYYNKEDIVKAGRKLGVDYSLTWSCYKGGMIACGKCGTCIERLEAFRANGIEDPIEYENKR